MTYRNYGFSGRILSELRDAKTREQAVRVGQLISSEIPPQTVEYVNNINFSREEMNEAFARARAQGKSLNAR